MHELDSVKCFFWQRSCSIQHYQLSNIFKRHHCEICDLITLSLYKWESQDKHTAKAAVFHQQAAKISCMCSFMNTGSACTHRDTWFTSNSSMNQYKRHSRSTFDSFPTFVSFWPWYLLFGLTWPGCSPTSPYQQCHWGFFWPECPHGRRDEGSSLCRPTSRDVQSGQIRPCRTATGATV